MFLIAIFVGRTGERYCLFTRKAGSQERRPYLDV